MPNKKGTGKVQTPKKAKRIIKIKRKSSVVSPPKKKEIVKAKNTIGNGGFVFKGLDGEKYSLTLQQKEFVEHYMTNRGNGVEAIIDAGYDVWKRDRDGNKLFPNRKLAAVMASENLIKPNIAAYVTILLDQYGYDDTNAEKQHLFLINQYGDLKTKAKALDMFFKIKGKYAPEQHEHKLDQEITEALSKVASLVK